MELNRQAKHEPIPLTECPLIAGEENADLLLDYCNRRLDPELAAVFERHMNKCVACEAFAASQSAVWKALDSFEAMPISDDFDARLFARIEQEQAGSAWGGFWNRLWNRITDGGTAIWRPALPVAAGLLLAVGLWLQPGFTPVPVQEAAVKADHVDVEQVEIVLEDMEMLRQLALAENGAGGQQM